MAWLKRLFRSPARPGQPVAQVMRSDWEPTHQHKKGGLYRRVGEAVLETDRSAVVIYDDAEGTVWVRPRAEFDQVDRFRPLT